MFWHQLVAFLKCKNKSQVLFANIIKTHQNESSEIWMLKKKLNQVNEIASPFSFSFLVVLLLIYTKINILLEIFHFQYSNRYERIRNNYNLKYEKKKNGILVTKSFSEFSFTQSFRDTLSFISSFSWLLTDSCQRYWTSSKGFRTRFIFNDIFIFFFSLSLSIA